MNEPTELSISELCKKRGANAPEVAAPASSEPPPRETFDLHSNSRRIIELQPEHLPESDARLPFDPLRLLDAVLRGWYLALLAGLVAGAGAFYWYYQHVPTIASMELLRRDAPMLFRASDVGDAFKPQQVTDNTLGALVRSPEIFQRISERSGTRLPPAKLAGTLLAKQESESEILTLYYKGPAAPKVAAGLLNLYGEEIVSYTREMQSHDGDDMAAFIGAKLSAVETNLADAQRQMAEIPPEMKVLDADKQIEAYLLQLSDLDVKYQLAQIDLEASNPAAEKLRAAREELAALLVKYTDVHPAVVDQRAKIATLERDLAAANKSGPVTASNIATSPLVTAQNLLLAKHAEEVKSLRDSIRLKLNTLSSNNFTYALIKSRYQALTLMRTALLSRQREAQLYAQDALGYYKIVHPAENAARQINWRKNTMISVAAGLFMAGLISGILALIELANPRIKTVADLERAARVPVLATLGDLSDMSDTARSAWAFRSWTIIKGKITATQHHAMVCGVMSARHGEGRSTWISLLAKTAFQRGLRVLVAATKPSADPPVHPHEKSVPLNGEEENALIKNVFAFPFQATRQLQDPNSHSIVHIPLPGWVWNLERRQQWQTALNEWRCIENLIFLVELPPADQPEAILLAENVPQMIWLADSGKVTASEVRSHLETLRHAGCHIVGAVLNREPPSFARRYLANWFGACAAAFLFAAGTAFAQDTTNVPAYQPGPQPMQRAQWQQRMTLGPGDVLSFSFYGDTNLTKTDVIIGMDGRVGYLQAQGVLAVGLTVDELRDRLDAELQKYYRTPRVMITPVAYRSKKYYIVGKVVAPGAYVLDHPVTIVEALARARGLQSGQVDRNVVDLADLQHSFLIRHGKRSPVDFEALFGSGDFAQNVQLEPEDFLYFAPANLKEVYVIGQVKAPGVIPYTDHSTVVAAISERGGFTDSAFKRHVIVVRGSLAKPQAFTVNVMAILDGREADAKLQPRDIVYVSNRPFIYAEELLDIAVTSFLQSAATSWAGEYIDPIIGKPFIPGP